MPKSNSESNKPSGGFADDVGGFTGDVVFTERKNKQKTAPLHDLLQAQAKAARAARCEFDSSSSSESDSDSDNTGAREGPVAMDTAAAEGGQMSEQTTEEIQASHGPFTPPTGWEIQPAPAPTQAAWAEQIKKRKKGSPFWRGVHLAHIFDDGWDTWAFQSREKEHLGFLLPVRPVEICALPAPRGVWTDAVVGASQEDIADELIAEHCKTRAL